MRSRPAKIEMKSPVYWTVLGMIRQRPDYGYALRSRYEREFGGLLALTSDSQIYNALEALEKNGLVEQVRGSAGPRQPKTIYRCSSRGTRAYLDWLKLQMLESRRRSMLLVRQLAELESSPEVALEVLDVYQEACAEEAASAPLVSAGDCSSLFDRLVAEERSIGVAAAFSWIDLARREFKAIARSKRNAP